MDSEPKLGVRAVTRIPEKKINKRKRKTTLCNNGLLPLFSSHNKILGLMDCQN